MSLQPGAAFEKKPLTIKRALISVFDKTGLENLAKKLHGKGVQLISTGGTAAAIKKAGIPVTDVSELTQFPECLDGRVKTLHPIIHGGILGRPNIKSDLVSMNEHGMRSIQLVVVNLYPFEETVRKNVGAEETIENIDIGGPAMIRAAAKNVDHSCVLTSCVDYDEFLEEFDKNGSIPFDFRLKLSKRAFSRTAAYDAAIASWFSAETESGFPETLARTYPKHSALRYGENPHQAAAVYGNQDQIIQCIHGKQLSYNNYLDVDAALNLIYDFRLDQPMAGIIKHTLPCGVALANNLSDAWDSAFATDTMSPFGGIVALNQTLDAHTAEKIDKIFTEIIIAPDFTPDALKLLKEKTGRRLVKIKNMESLHENYALRSVFGGVLCQQPDTAPPEPKTFQVVTERQPDKDELKDMLFAWKVVKRVNSNAIVFAKNQRTLGIGSGQPSRIDASEIAVLKAKKYDCPLDASVIASDAFFPFPDGVEAAAKAGAKAVIQPGGSIRDKEVIEAANKYGMTMIFTGRRHFKH